MPESIAIGMRTGSSLEALDIVACRFRYSGNEYDWELLHGERIPLELKWKGRLMKLREQSAEILAKTHIYFGHWLGQQAKDFIDRNKLKPNVIGASGYRVFHQPEKNFTMQIGDGETAAAYLDCPFVSNFSTKNVALNGDGYPIDTLGNKFLFPEYDLFLNLGSSVSLEYQGLAGEIAPCNLVLDYLLGEYLSGEFFDEHGELAASGSLDTELLDALNSLSFFKRPFPKSMSLKMIYQKILPGLLTSGIGYPELLHTYCIHISQQIGNVLGSMGISGGEMVLSGGGRKNLFLLDQIQQILGLRGIKLAKQADSSILDFKQAIIYSFLGLRLLEGRDNTKIYKLGTYNGILSGSVHLPHKGYKDFLI